MPTKCIAFHLPTELMDKIVEHKAKTGKSQGGTITDLIEKGLGISDNHNPTGNLLFFVKVRIDTNRMIEFGEKLQNGEIDTSHIIQTFCIKNDPTVGLSFWQANSRYEFDEIFRQHTPYYKEIIEVLPVITSMDSMKIILENLKIC